MKYNECTPQELKHSYSIDKYIKEKSVIFYRTISINAPAKTVFSWIAQLRYAPYSYDWIDNFGRKSPQQIIPNTPPLKIGDAIMRWFRLTEFKENEFLTYTFPEDAPAYLKIFFKPASFYSSYQLFPVNEHCTRLVLKIVINSGDSLFDRVLIKLADWLDYVMMRRQLLNFKRLAENKSHA